MFFQAKLFLSLLALSRREYVKRELVTQLKPKLSNVVLYSNGLLDNAYTIGPQVSE
jgi:hypothetical protein